METRLTLEGVSLEPTHIHLITTTNDQENVTVEKANSICDHHQNTNGDRI